MRPIQLASRVRRISRWRDYRGFCPKITGFSRRWGGIRGFSPHSLPRIHFIPHPGAISRRFSPASEVISVLSELGVIILLFEIGLESDLQELIWQSVNGQLLVAVVGVAVPFLVGTLGLIYIFPSGRHSRYFCRGSFNRYQYRHYRQGFSRNRAVIGERRSNYHRAAVLDDILGIIVSRCRCFFGEDWRSAN
ncbi:MAG UNVERIFIED_CONTAM: cation:proton antiporter [Microcystis novacekii LVE1205-3]|jgi:hypothetical protein